MGSIDSYAYDPLAAARKALVSVLRQPRITADSDFHVLTTLSRSILQRDLGLKLTEPAELVMVTEVIRHLAWMWGTTWALNQGQGGVEAVLHYIQQAGKS